jgi:hypothetical protein
MCPSKTLVAVALAIGLQACSQAQQPPASEGPAPADAPAGAFSIREVMTHIIDPTADYIWDATGADITAAGVVEHKPETDEDWAMVTRGVVSVAEGAALLKMPRPVAPADDYVSKNPGELPPAEIQALIDRERGVFNAYADAMRNEALKILEVVKARDVARLTAAGDDLDRTCESCHLHFWYPGDRAAVERDRGSKVTVSPPSTPQGR